MKISSLSKKVEKDKTVCSIANLMLETYKKKLVETVEKEDWETAHSVLLKIDEILAFTSARCEEEVTEEIR